MRALLAIVCMLASGSLAFAQDGSSLSGTTWRLVQFAGGDGRIQKPPMPDNFTLEFLAGGALAARIDCNRARGSWKVTPPSAIALDTKVMTRAFCGKDSMDAQIVKHLPLVRSFTMNNGHLFLSLMADGGNYEFEPVTALKSPLAPVGQASFRCDGSETTTATFYKTEPGLVVLTRGSETRVAFSVVSASGARYLGDNVSFWEAKGAATINWSGAVQKCQRLP